MPALVKPQASAHDAQAKATLESYQQMADGFKQLLRAIEIMAERDREEQGADLSADIAALAVSVTKAIESIKPQPRRPRKMVFNVVEHDDKGRIKKVEVVES